MVQDAAGLLPAEPAEAPASAGASGPGELSPARPEAPAAQPWDHPGPETRTRVPEHATGHVLDAVA